MAQVTIKVTLANGANAYDVSYRSSVPPGGHFIHPQFVNDQALLDLASGSYDIAWCVWGNNGGTISITVEGSTGTGQPFTDKIGNDNPECDGNSFDVP